MEDAGTERKKGADRAAVVTLLFAILGIAALLAAGALSFIRWYRDTVASPPASTSVTVPTTLPSIPTLITTTTTPGTASSVVDLPSLVTIVDDTGALEVSVPAAWSDVGTGAWSRGGEAIGASVMAATDRTGWVDGWGVSGVFVGASTTLGFTDALGDFSSPCVLVGAEPWVSGGLTGVAQRWSECGPEGSDFLVAVATDGTVVLLVQVVTIAGDPPGLAAAILDSVLHHGG